MNNFYNFVENNKINSQLEKAGLRKSTLIRNIYREYEIYLNLIRDQLYISVEKGLNELSRYLSIKDNFLNTNEISCLFEKKIGKIVYARLPLLTVEQLKINEIEKNKKYEINLNITGSPSKTKLYQKERFQYEDVFKFEEPIQFQIEENISNSSDYYQSENHEKLASLDLDINDINNSLANKFIENIGVEKQFISLLEIIEEVKDEKRPGYLEKDNLNQIGISNKYQSFKNFDVIDKSLENLLLNLSYKINQELFKANLIKKIISKDSFEYLLAKKFMIRQPYPFVINFEFNLNHSSLNDENFQNIILFNISTVELEFKNLNLSIQRNKIIDLKNQFQRLIKKETYWKQKEITLNKIS